MSPRTGRPKIENPMNERVIVRLSHETMEFLDKYCENHNIKRTDAIRKGIELLRESEK